MEFAERFRTHADPRNLVCVPIGEDADMVSPTYFTGSFRFLRFPVCKDAQRIRNVIPEFILFLQTLLGQLVNTAGGTLVQPEDVQKISHHFLINVIISL